MAASKWIRQDFPPTGAATAPPTRPARGVTVLQSREVPLFAALVAQWQSAGRMVPGHHDTEWSELVGRVPRVTGR